MVVTHGACVSTAWGKHREQWKDCQLCPLSSNRTNVVLARGDLPCEILFIGEGPGASEDAKGLPFVGRSGKRLDQIILHIQEEIHYRLYDGDEWAHVDLIYAITNVVACRPPDNRDPTPDEIKACRPRLEQLVDMANPRMVVLVGKVAKKHWDKVEMSNDIPSLSIHHPAYLLRLRKEDARLKQQGDVNAIVDMYAQEVIK